MKWLKNIFRKRDEQTPQPLRIEGAADAPMTAEPDDAELAAQALLESMAAQRTASGRRKERKDKASEMSQTPDEHSAEYYRRFAGRVRQARSESVLRTARFLAFCEQQLSRDDIPVTGDSSLSLMETEFYKRIDTIDREGGQLKERWQHCLAEVTVRLMSAPAYGK